MQTNTIPSSPGGAAYRTALGQHRCVCADHNLGSDRCVRDIGPGERYIEYKADLPCGRVLWVTGGWPA